MPTPNAAALLLFIRQQRNSIYPLISKSTGKLIPTGGVSPEIACAAAYGRALALCAADPSWSLPPERGPDPQADLNNLERWCLKHVRAEAGNQGKLAPASRGGNVSQGDSLSKEARALATLKDHPDWTNAQIAEVAGCHVKTLSKWSLFKDARAAMKEGKYEVPRGTKSQEGDLEAWGEDKSR
jgi:hypothetical protein